MINYSSLQNPHLKEIPSKLNCFVPEIQITNDQPEITRDITIYSEYIDLARNDYFYKEPKKYFFSFISSYLMEGRKHHN